MAGFFIYFEQLMMIPMKKKMLLGLVSILFLIVAFAGWELLGPGTAFSANKYSLYIRTGMNFSQVMDIMEKDTVLKSPRLFKWFASKTDYPQNIKAGKFDLKTGLNLLSILHILRNGRQTPVNLVITKLRTKEDLASLTGRKLECDSASFIHFLENKDSLKEFNLEPNTVMTAVFPNTYTFFWNSTPSRIFKKMYAEYKIYWTESRRELAKERGLNPTTAYILASIVEEETGKQDDKGKIASVYINRLAKGMRLSADPTIKFALHNFELKRVYEKYLSVESPYNTYKYAGLPPGPICTPAPATLDAILNSPKTNYLYFVAKPDFSGYSNFSESFQEHLKYAREYQKSLDEQMKIGHADKEKAGH
jgi:UPF0755 protein